MLIGLCGKPTSGKSKVASILVDEFNFQLLDSKDILRKITSEITSIPYSTLKTPSGKDNLYKGVEVRKIMGDIGSTLEELFGSDFLMEKALEYWDGNNAVFDSLRKFQPVSFPGYVVEVSSPTANRKLENKYLFDYYHKEKIEYQIENPGEIKGLFNEVSKMIDYFNECEGL